MKLPITKYFGKVRPEQVLAKNKMGFRFFPRKNQRTSASLAPGTFEWITAMSGLSILDVGAKRWGAAQRALCGVIRLAAVRISEFVAEILPSAGQSFGRKNHLATLSCW